MWFSTVVQTVVQTLFFTCCLDLLTESG